MANVSISNVNFNVFNKEESTMKNVAYYLNDVAVSYEEAAEFVPVVEKKKKVVKATTAKKVADLAGFLAVRFNCSFNGFNAVNGIRRRTTYHFEILLQIY